VTPRRFNVSDGKTLQRLTITLICGVWAAAARGVVARITEDEAGAGGVFAAARGVAARVAEDADLLVEDEAGDEDGARGGVTASAAETRRAAGSCLLVVCCGRKSQFQHGKKKLWSKLSVSARPECVVVNIISFSMGGMIHGPNQQFQHGRNVFEEKIPKKHYFFYKFDKKFKIIKKQFSQKEMNNVLKTVLD
jgi:hypothetical protein